jgi:hypothetical protein
MEMTAMELEGGERIIGTWSVYVGEQGVNTAKISGKLYVTDTNFYFQGGLHLQENAAAAIGQGVKAFAQSAERVKIPLSEIARVQILKQMLILKSLQITLRSGEQKVFHFGVMSPKKAATAICSRTGLRVE